MTHGAVAGRWLWFTHFGGLLRRARCSYAWGSHLSWWFVLVIIDAEERIPGVVYVRLLPGRRVVFVVSREDSIQDYYSFRR